MDEVLDRSLIRESAVLAPPRLLPGQSEADEPEQVPEHLQRSRREEAMLPDPAQGEEEASGLGLMTDSWDVEPADEHPEEDGGAAARQLAEEAGAETESVTPFNESELLELSSAEPISARAAIQSEEEDFWEGVKSAAPPSFWDGLSPGTEVRMQYRLHMGAGDGSAFDSSPPVGFSPRPTDGSFMTARGSPMGSPADSAS